MINNQIILDQPVLKKYLVNEILAMQNIKSINVVSLEEWF
jgi:hypothetical protein